VKLIDFGSSCFDDEKPYKYIQSRFYRAPEVILQHDYTPAIDMWSLGCLAVELLIGEPLFPGENEHEQLCLIQDIIGRIPDDFIDRGSRRKVFRMFIPRPDDVGGYDLAESTGFKPTLRSIEGIVMGKLGRREGSEESQTDYMRFMDFVQGLLRYDVGKRMDPGRALEHCFFRTEHREVGVMTEKTTIGVKNVPSEVYEVRRGERR
jgi:dual specificity tyrosine-phosphorylation-regulated kinase 1